MRAMVELLGVLLAAVIAGLGWLLWRLARLLRGLLPAKRPLRAAPLRLARRRIRHADARGDALAEENRRLRLALRLAERERDALKAGAAPGSNDRFAQAKRAFALRFHPDRITAGAMERIVRVSMFREYWAELKRIERG